MIKITKYINLKYLLLSFIVGLIAVYLVSEENRIVYIYPTPENVDLMLYRDKANQCFAFEHTEVTCPNNPLDIARVPVQG